MPRLVFVVTSGLTARHLLRGQLAHFRARGWEVEVIASPGPDLDAVRDREQIPVHGVPIPREIDPRADLRALVQLTATLRRLQPDVVHASTPKAGLLGMVAAKLARVPVRVYLLRGLRLETATGAKRRVLMATERIAMTCAHEVHCVSASLRARTLELGLTSAERLRVLGDGSSNGVDARRFDPATPGRAERVATLRRSLGVSDDAPVVGFVGRLVRDKGMRELADALTVLRRTHPRLWLLVVGDFEAGDPVDADVRARLLADPRVLITGMVPDTADHYGLMDVLAFPTYREGFPNVPLEAACAEVPVVAFAATGVVDAIVSGETGELVPVRDAAALASALARYLEDPSRRASHGTAARARAIARFTPERIWDALEARLGELLLTKGRTPPSMRTPATPARS